MDTRQDNDPITQPPPGPIPSNPPVNIETTPEEDALPFLPPYDEGEHIIRWVLIAVGITFVLGVISLLWMIFSR